MPPRNKLNFEKKTLFPRYCTEEEADVQGGN